MLAGVMGLFASVPILHVVAGVLLLTKGQRHANPDLDPRWFAWLFIVAGAVCVTLGWTLAVCFAIAARSIARPRNYTFCLIVAFLVCLCFPFGTVLGVFTIVVMSKPAVRALFPPRAAVVSIPAIP